MLVNAVRFTGDQPVVAGNNAVIKIMDSLNKTSSEYT